MKSRFLRCSPSISHTQVLIDIHLRSFAKQNFGFRWLTLGNRTPVSRTLLFSCEDTDRRSVHMNMSSCLTSSPCAPSLADMRIWQRSMIFLLSGLPVFLLWNSWPAEKTDHLLTAHPTSPCCRHYASPSATSSDHDTNYSIEAPIIISIETFR